ncbi:MAG: type IV toxin-antitoxin system AbiEi family antitoxin domain-containing protein [Halolamina sp.]
MRPVDERILELMRDEGNCTPRAVQDFGVTSQSHASDRLSELARYGLVERISRGLYRLTDDGRMFLDETVDASELEPDGDADDS